LFTSDRLRTVGEKRTRLTYEKSVCPALHSMVLGAAKV
jgi:hypothetical protein